MPRPPSSRPRRQKKSPPSPSATVSNFLIFPSTRFLPRIIGRQFFPSTSELSSLMLSLATFGVGFLMRPLGGIIIGGIADRKGRKYAMTLTLWLMAAGSALFIVTPTYAQIGVAAPLLVVLGLTDPGLCRRRRSGCLDLDADGIRERQEPRLLQQLAIVQPGAQHPGGRRRGPEPDLYPDHRATGKLGLASALRVRHAAGAARLLHPPRAR